MGIGPLLNVILYFHVRETFLLRSGSFLNYRSEIVGL